MKPAVASSGEGLGSKSTSKSLASQSSSNVDAKPHSDPAVIKKLLATQVTSPVLWENTMDSVLSKDFGRAVELGPGKVTAGILKRFDKTAECVNVEV